MASIVFTATIGTNPPDTITATLADADLEAVIGVAGASYFPEGVMGSNGLPQNPPVAPTPLQVMQAMVGGVINGWAANVQQAQKQAAAAAATASINPIPVTVT
jgi:hypothetical protein